MSIEHSHPPEIGCPSCGRPGDGAFCPHCGEEMKPERITFRYVVSQFFEIFVGFESNRLLHTFRDLAIRPGKTIRRYLEGERKPYYNPVDYALLTGGLVIVWSLLISDGVLADLQRRNAADPGMSELAKKISADPSAFFNSVFLLQFPVAGLLTWLRSMKGGQGYGEHLYANAYMIGELFAFQLLFNSLYYLFDAGPFLLVLAQVYMFAAFFYYVVAYSQWRHGAVRFPRILLTVPFLAFVYILSFLLAFGLAAGWLYLYGKWTGS
jgi:hypothetical protein